MAQSISRRTFLGTAVGAAGMLAGKWESSAQVAESVAASPWIETTIPQLQALCPSGQLTSRAADPRLPGTGFYRLNPAARGGDRDQSERRLHCGPSSTTNTRKGRVRGPLHGIPVLVKDNIATDDNMETTAGSLALVGDPGAGRRHHRRPAGRSPAR